jgi:glycosyltransferase involved in cell wall biosynthesis
VRVCHVVYGYFPGQGFTAIYEYVTGEARLGLEVKVIALQRPGEPEIERSDNLQIWRIPAATGDTSLKLPGRLDNLANFIRRANRRLSGYPLDIVHIYSAPGLFLLPWLQRYRTDAKWVCDIRSGGVNPGLRAQLGDWCTAWQTRFFDAVFVISEMLALRLFGSLPPQVYLAPLGVNFEHFKIGEASALRRQLNLGSQITLIYAGSLAPSRRLGALLRAFQQALQHRQDLHLLVVGDGGDYERLLAMAQELQIAKHITFTGSVPYERVPQYLSVADIGLSYVPVTREYQAQPPLKTVEYLACGLPVIATNLASNHLFLQHEHNGLLVGDDVASWANAILYLAEHAEQRRRFASVARASVQKYDWQTLVKDYVIPAYVNILTS